MGCRLTPSCAHGKPCGWHPSDTVRVDLYTGEECFPAFGEAGRFADDAATVVVIPAYEELEAR